jgi:type IV pilus assembly protein PilM
MALGLFQSGQLALDIGGSSLVALDLSGKPGRLKLRRCHEWPLPEGLVVDGEIVDVDLFARELKAFVSHNKLRGRAVQLALSNQKVIVRNIDMPEMTEDELRGAIGFQAQDYIPIPVDEVVLDFQALGKRVAADGSVRQEVLLVAAQKTMVDAFVSAVKQAGLKVSGIDVSSLALVRALIPSASVLAAASETGVCRGIVDISSSVSTLLVAVDGVLKFTRIINFSSDRFPRTLSEGLGIPYDDAQTMVQRVGLPGPLSPDDEYYPEDVVTDTQQRLRKVAVELSDEIRRSFDYYQGQEQATPVAELLVSGRGALVRNLDAHLAEALGIRAELGNPLTQVAQNSSLVPDAGLAYMAPYLAVPIGLALPADDRGIVRRVNLLPVGERTRTTTDYGTLALLGVVIVAIFALAFGYYLLHNTLGDRERELADVQQQTTSLESQVASLDQYARLQAQRVSAEKLVQGIYANRTLVSNVLDALSLVVPDTAWFESMALTTTVPTGTSASAGGAATAVTQTDNNLTIQGNTYSFEDVAQVLVRLQLLRVPLPTVLSGVHLVSAGEPVGETDPAIAVKGFSIEASVVNDQPADTPLPMSQVEVEGP